MRVQWQGEDEIPVAQLGRRTEIHRRSTAKVSTPNGCAPSRSKLRPRGGGERFKPHPARPSKTLKRLFQDAGIAGVRAWPIAAVMARRRADFRRRPRRRRALHRPRRRTHRIEWEPDASLIEGILKRCKHVASAHSYNRAPLRPRSDRIAISMALIVHKYGGTSVGSVDRINNVAHRLEKWHRAGHQLVVVVSAMSGETNRLIGLAKQVQQNPDRARARRRRVDRRAGHRRPAGDGAARARAEGKELHRAASARADRQRVQQGAHPEYRREENSRRPATAERSSSSPDFRASTSTATSRRSAAAAPTPRPSRWPRR